MFDIPELDDLIYPELKRGDLARCAQVNKKWNKCVLPYLWHDMTFLEDSHHKVKAALRMLVAEDFIHEQWQQNIQKGKQDTDQQVQPTSPFSSALTKYGPWIRKAPDPKVLLSCFRLPPHINVKRLKAMTGQKNHPTPEELLQHFYKCCSIIQVNTLHLSHEDLKGNIWRTITKEVVFQVRHLTIEDDLGDAENAKKSPRRIQHLLDRLSTTLETLALNNIMQVKDEAEDTGTKEWTSLKELLVEDCLGSSESFWTWLWRRCSHVEKLIVGSVDGALVQNLSDGMLTHMQNVDAIQLGWIRCGSQGEEDKIIAALLCGSRKGWKIVDMSGNEGFGRAAMKALTGHFLTLRVLLVDGCSGLTGDGIIQALSSCPNLHTLVAINDASYPHGTGFTRLNADVFIDRDPSTGALKPWLCESSLKILKVMIGGIPRPDLGHSHTAETPIGQGRGIQNFVYERLARLGNLETLWLGHDPLIDGDELWYNERDFQDDCLEISLKSGLGALAGLKELKELNLSRMKRRTELDDIRWMADNWPKLKTIYGLDRENDTYFDALQENYPHINTPDVRDFENEYDYEYEYEYDYEYDYDYEDEYDYGETW
ncbi:hypothetical protein B0O80DRAFT_448504 [Mortierella sp. GBAus27b]|nr:hypothetical protein BGX31_006194 [Mortierella sp. GBA43]KAI8356011.1 hypothetical protein B0O80DRAFT_448504 [Mortierella sp. GBAus27b]